MSKGFGFFQITDPGLDDDDLDEIQELLWRGYVPERYPRHDWYVWQNVLVHPQQRKPRKPKPAPEPAPPKTVPQWSEFHCDGCHRWFRSITDEAEADAAYRETFGDKATDERLALCEGC